jgi:hypothetical protein
MCHSFVHMCSLTLMWPMPVAGMPPLSPRITIVCFIRGVNDENHSQHKHMVLNVPESNIYMPVKLDSVGLSSPFSACMMSSSLQT